MLAPCPSCSRLVRGSETECPFCKRPFASTTTAPVVRKRLTRAAALAAVAAIGVACGGTVGPAGDAGSDAAPNDASTKDASPDSPPDASFNDQISVPPYGIPPLDGG